jgi:hypothetical protein
LVDGVVSGSVVFLVDFLDFELGDSLVLSVADALLGDFSVLASGFFVNRTGTANQIPIPQQAHA